MKVNITRNQLVIGQFGLHVSVSSERHFKCESVQVCVCVLYGNITETIEFTGLDFNLLQNCERTQTCNVSKNMFFSPLKVILNCPAVSQFAHCPLPPIVALEWK